MTNFKLTSGSLSTQSSLVEEVPTSAGVYGLEPVLLKVVEQGGIVVGLLLACLLVWLITQLLEKAK